MPPKHTQKNLTVMFTDISGFTRHTETISRDALMERLETHNALLMPIVAHFDGRLIKTIGDAFLITFESPTNAVQCGMLMQHRLREFNAGKTEHEQIHIKVSVNAGEVAVTETDVFGDPVNVAAKIEKATSPDEIYFTEAVFLAMNKAEVPNTFVKTFRPKGADSQEIKLYRVVQDEEEKTYRRVIDGVHIDEEATRARTEALSTTATKEAGRYRDAIEHLVEGQRRSTRTLLVAIVGGLAVLGAGAYFGLKAMGPGNEAEKQMTSGVRTYLAAGKPTDAMAVYDGYVASHGHSDGVDRLRTEIATAIWSAAKATAEDASLRLASGDAGPASRVEEPRTMALPAAAIDPEEVRTLLRGLKTRAAALDRAKERLESGDVLEARKAALVAAGPLPPSGDLRALVARADALDAARSMLGFPDAEAQAPEVIARLSTAYGDDASDRAALEVLARAFGLELGALARNDGRAAALARREELRLRFKNFTGWSAVQRDLDLGSLWEYAGAKRDAWRNGTDELYALMRDLKAAGAKDAEFQYRLAVTLHGVQRARNEIGLNGMTELEAALRAEPKLLERHETETRALLEYWLGEEQDPDSFARRLVSSKWFDAMRSQLTSGLSATTGEGADARPDVAKRANSFAILVDHGEPNVVADRILFLTDMLPAFVEGSTPQLSHAHAKALFGGKMEHAEFVRLRAQLEAELESARAGQGPFGASTDAKAHLAALLEDLLVSQPDLAKAK